MILTVTPNPALDITWVVDRLEVGQTHRADTAAVRAGGKGVNVARVAHAQGAHVRAVVTAGGATGEEFVAELRTSGVPTDVVPVAAATRRSAAWVDRTAGDTTIVNERGVALTADEWRSVEDAVRAPDGVRVLVISGSFPPDTPAEVLDRLIAAGAQSDAAVIVDTSGPLLLRAADAGAAVLKPNRAELAEATGLDDPLAGARELLRRGARLVLLSLGADGMYAVTPDRTLHARVPDVLSGNPTGAGDAAVAACATLLADGITDPEQILRRATSWSAAAVLMPLAGEISPAHERLAADLLLADATDKDTPA